jgi:hypothetical protein
MFKIKKRYCSIGIYLHIKENFNPNNISKWSDVPDHNDGVKLQKALLKSSMNLV